MKEKVYVEQPQGFVADSDEYKVCKLKKALYGLKKAPQAWYDKVDKYFLSIELERSISEPTLFVKKELKETSLIVSLYLDDMLVIGSCRKLLMEFKMQMQSEFEMFDLGNMTYFLGLEVF